jgi:hypothetical protein
MANCLTARHLNPWFDGLQIMEKLKRSGNFGGKYFSAKDFENLSPEEISAKVGYLKS